MDEGEVAGKPAVMADGADRAMCDDTRLTGAVLRDPASVPDISVPAIVWAAFVDPAGVLRIADRVSPIGAERVSIRDVIDACEQDGRAARLRERAALRGAGWTLVYFVTAQEPAERARRVAMSPGERRARQRDYDRARRQRVKFQGASDTAA